MGRILLATPLIDHASVALATPAVSCARFVPYFNRSRGQSDTAVAKVAGRDPPAEAVVAAVTSVATVGWARRHAALSCRWWASSSGRALG